MTNIPFVGRQHELKSLNLLRDKKSASLVVITGRRRIGKSRLVEEFAHDKLFYSFTGIPPTHEITAQLQRQEFARQLGEQLELPGLSGNDWGDLFTVIAKQTSNKKVVILLDEISWMGSRDPTFLGKLKIAWDLYFKKNTKLILILCGSVSSWIEKNILSSTGFFGRVTQKITLDELPLYACNRLLDTIGFKGSIIEKFLLLGIMGGIPWYIELINPTLSAENNVKALCFMKDGILVDEFQRIFHDLFDRRFKINQRIIELLAKQKAEYHEISNIINYSSGGPLTDYLNDMVTTGFISRDYAWSFKSGKTSNRSQYRIKDNYLRFYLRYIAPNLNKIKQGSYKHISLSSLSGWESIMELQFENIILNNRNLIWQALGISPEEIANDNPYFQRQTKQHKGCQIDYLIQTKYNTLFACEVKFSKREVRSAVLENTRRKISRLMLPRGFSCFPVLIHVNGVSSEIEDSDYFAKIIDFGKLLDLGIS